MRSRLLFAVSLALVLSACGGATPAPSSPPPDQTAAPSPTGGEPAASGWDAFWASFKQAALAKDLNALAALTAIGPELDQATFDLLADTYLSPEVLAKLEQTDAAAVPIKDDGEGPMHVFEWSETAMVDGEEVGTALFFYFREVDGQFKLYRLLAAG